VVVARKRKGDSNISLGINEREKKLLKALVDSYIKDGQPVGSKALAKDSGLEISSATIRSIMSDLEEMGLVSSPHTSAGRIPTTKGFRLFVDGMVTIKPPSPQDIENLKLKLKLSADVDDLLGSVSSVLSETTSMAGVVMLPRREHSAIRRIEFMRLSEKRVLAILVISDHEVENKVIETMRDYSSCELQEAANFLSDVISGKDLHQVRQYLVSELVNTKERVNQMMQMAIEMADKVFDEKKDKKEYVLSGQTNLMNFSELANLDKIRSLFDVFNAKRDVLHLLDECMAAQSMRVFIGEESGFSAFEGCSIVTSPYQVDGKILGVLGVIGPTRMAYERVIPLVDVTAKMLGMILNQRG
jgi:heat-inducible transcriptional repressor